MNKVELVAAVAGHTRTDPKVVAVVLNGTEDVIVATVKKGNEKVVWTGFVGFDQVARKARRGRNPATGEAIRVKAKKAPRVSAGVGFKKVVAGEAPAPKIAVTNATASRPAKTTPPIETPAPMRPTAAAPTKRAGRRAPIAAASKATPLRGARAVVGKSSTAKSTASRATKR